MKERLPLKLEIVVMACGWIFYFILRANLEPSKYGDRMLTCLVMGNIYLTIVFSNIKSKKEHLTFRSELISCIVGWFSYFATIYLYPNLKYTGLFLLINIMISIYLILPFMIKTVRDTIEKDDIY